MEPPIDDTIRVLRDALREAQDESDKKLLKKQVAALEDIRTLLVKREGLRYRIEGFEKLISDPWMNDQKTFDRVYVAWSTFKHSYARTVGGMTVDERLYFMGLLDEFDACKGDPEAMRTVLRAAFLSPENIEAIIQNH
jgi:hypothetical protein